MRIFIYVNILALTTLFSCRKDVDLQDRLTATQADLMLAQAELAKAAIPPAITHLVYLDTKDSIDVLMLEQELARLGEIPGVKDYQVGTFLQLDDPRALAQYELVLSMGFASREDYQTYQEHPIHIAVKKQLQSFLAGPPVTYDFE